MFEKALLFAMKAHEGQFRKGTLIPYIMHPICVAQIVQTYGGTMEEIVAALLHDVAEDQGGEEALAEIRALFGDLVAELVAGCSDDLPAKGQKKIAWQTRKEKYLKHLRLAGKSVQLVSAADKLHNAQSILNDYKQIGELLWERFNADKQQTLWYYEQLAKIFNQSDIPKELNDKLMKTVQELKNSLK